MPITQERMKVMLDAANEYVTALQTRHQAVLELLKIGQQHGHTIEDFATLYHKLVTDTTPSPDAYLTLKFEWKYYERTVKANIASRSRVAAWRAKKALGRELLTAQTANPDLYAGYHNEIANRKADAKSLGAAFANGTGLEAVAKAEVKAPLEELTKFVPPPNTIAIMDSVKPSRSAQAEAEYRATFPPGTLFTKDGPLIPSASPEEAF